MPSFEVVQPTTTEEATEILARYGDEARIHSGGTDLMVNVKNRTLSPRIVVDLARLKDLHYIREDREHLRIGATISMSRLVDHLHPQGSFAGLREAALRVGSVQIRNRATLAGNICNGSPAADTLPPLVALGTTVVLIGPEGKRSVPLQDFISGPGKTVIERGELLESVVIPLPDQPNSSASMRMTRRRYEDLALVSVAVVLRREETPRVCFGAVTAKFSRAEATERELGSYLAGESEFKSVESAVDREITPITDVRASDEYRLAMAKVLLRRTAETAMERLKAQAGEFEPN